MKKIILFLMAAMMIACGGSSGKVTNPVPAGPPWEQLPVSQQERYVTELDCPTATSMVTEISTWPVTDSTDFEAGYRVYLHYLDESMSAYTLQRTATDGKIVAAMLVINGYQFMIVDYNVIRAVDTGTLTGNEDTDTFYSSATGEYFCFWL